MTPVQSGAPNLGRPTHFRGRRARFVSGVGTAGTTSAGGSVRRAFGRVGEGGITLLDTEVLDLVAEVPDDVLEGNDDLVALHQLVVQTRDRRGLNRSRRQ